MDDSRQPIDPGYLPIFHTTRGDVIESIHFGGIAVVASSGAMIAGYGDTSTISFLRSSAKPLQAIALLEEGGAEEFQLSEEEIAVICSSHSGTDLHLKTVTCLQRKIGLTESDLSCGTHQPFSVSARALLLDLGKQPGQNHHNCSGKHTGMLALAKLLGAPLQGYTEPDHPVQQKILAVVADLCGLDADQILLGRDGCSVPAYAMPLRNAALGWARLMDPSGLSRERQAACLVITRSMKNHPYLVAGPGRFDTRMMETGSGKILSKAGAEAYQALGLVPGTLGPDSPAAGIVLKISDGDQGKRTRRAVMLEVLRQLNALSADQLNLMRDLGPVLEIKNQRRILTGIGKPCFQLQYS